MNEAFNRIRDGLEQAIAHASGEPVDVAVHNIDIPDVKAIRQQTGLTQEQFASRCRVTRHFAPLGARRPSA